MEDLRYEKIIHHLIREQLDNGNNIALRVFGRSMHPLVKKGEPIYIKKCDAKELSIGDIITFKKDDVYVTHRVLWMLKKGNTISVITRGDNEVTVDSPVSPRQILGKVAAVQRADHILHLESPPWRLINRLLGILFLMETVFILFYRFAASKSIPLTAFVHATVKPSRLYRRLKSRSLDFATRIIM
jgi:signal peptidase I